MKRVAILGSTGSIGVQTLEAIETCVEMHVDGIAAGSNWQRLAEQSQKFSPKFVALADESAADSLKKELSDDIELLTGPDAMTDMVKQSKPDILLSGIMGAAGLKPTLAAIEIGADLAIANKETLVMAGQIVMPLAREKGVSVLPVDSEHSAIFQCLTSGKRSEVRKVVITASGGALRDWDDEDAQSATVDDALKHPTWQMGQKITIDSATLMNKALEIIEAHWLFDLPADEIEVVLHPESIIHSCVEFCDGSVIAQMGNPDMTLPIAYALNHPDRPVRNTPPLDLVKLQSLNFRPLPKRCKRAINLGFEVIKRGGLSGAVLNAANEQAVHAFLKNRIKFGQIVDIVEELLNKTPDTVEITLEALISVDQWARDEVEKMI